MSCPYKSPNCNGNVRKKTSALCDGCQAREVQHEYVNARVHTIMSDVGNLFQQTVAALGRYAMSGKSVKKREVAFYQMQKKLQESDLTINFHADRWFFTENKYEDYATMYELGAKSTQGQTLGKMVLTDDDAKNPARLRQAPTILLLLGNCLKAM